MKAELLTAMNSQANSMQSQMDQLKRKTESLIESQHSRPASSARFNTAHTTPTPSLLPQQPPRNTAHSQGGQLQPPLLQDRTLYPNHNPLPPPNQTAPQSAMPPHGPNTFTSHPIPSHQQGRERVQQALPPNNASNQFAPAQTAAVTPHGPQTIMPQHALLPNPNLNQYPAYQATRHQLPLDNSVNQTQQPTMTVPHQALSFTQYPTLQATRHQPHQTTNNNQNNHLYSQVLNQQTAPQMNQTYHSQQPAQINPLRNRIPQLC